MKVPSRLLDTRFARDMSLRWKDRLDGTIPNCAEISPADNPRGPTAASSRKIANRECCAIALKASNLVSSSISVAQLLSNVVCSGRPAQRRRGNRVRMLLRPHALRTHAHVCERIKPRSVSAETLVGFLRQSIHHRPSSFHRWCSPLRGSPGTPPPLRFLRACRSDPRWRA